MTEICENLFNTIHYKYSTFLNEIKPECSQNFALILSKYVYCHRQCSLNALVYSIKSKF